jgi:hypothetical protein
VRACERPGASLLGTFEIFSQCSDFWFEFGRNFPSAYKNYDGFAFITSGIYCFNTILVKDNTDFGCLLQHIDIYDNSKNPRRIISLEGTDEGGRKKD